MKLAVYNEDDEQEVFIGDMIPARRLTRNNHHSIDKTLFIDEIKVMPPNFIQLTEFINAKHCRRPY